MKITVDRILELKSFSNAELIAGRKGMNREVSNASLMEVPDIFPYIDEKTLLLTTLYPIYNDERAMNNLIPELAAKNVSGICIKPARYVDKIPQIMLEQADKLDIPLIKLPPEANLSKMANEILGLSLNEYISILRFRNYIHVNMMELYLKGEGLTTLVDSFSQLVKYPVILFSVSMDVICTSGDLAELKIDCFINNRQRAEGLDLNNLYMHDNDELVIRVRDCEYKKDSYIIQPIKAGTELFGYIVLLKSHSDDEDLDENLKVAVENTSLLIASVFQKNKAILEKERNFLDAFIRDILHGKIVSQIEAIEKAKAFGWSLEFPQVMMVIKVIEDNEFRKKQIYESLLESNYIGDLFSTNFSKSRDKVKSVYLDDSLVIFINSLFVKQVREKAFNMGKELIEKLREDAVIGIGISNTVERISEFPVAYGEVRDCIRVGGILNTESFIYHQDDLSAFKVIKEVENTEALKSFMYKKLGAVLEYDKHNEVGLLKTLVCLIENNFNLHKASQCMFVHYNTIRYRMDKIKELGINLESGFELGELVMAYNIFIWLKANNKLQ